MTSTGNLDNNPDQTIIVSGTSGISTINATSPISASTSGSTATIAHDPSGVAAGTYGSASESAVFNVTNGGHLSTASNQTIDHNAIANLTSGDAHTQYLLSLGRVAGQVAYGGTASGDDLELYSTSNATKGNILVGQNDLFHINEDTERIGIGTSVLSDTVQGSNNASKLKVEHEGSDTFALHIQRNLNDASSGKFLTSKSRGTGGTPLVVQNGDGLFEMNFAGYDGSSYEYSSRIIAQVDAAVSSGIVPGRMRFQTADAAGTTQTAVEIDSNQDTTFSGDTINANAYKLQGVPISSAAPSGNDELIYNSGTGEWEPSSTSGHDATSLQGTAISTTSPNDEDHLVYNSGTGEWEPTAETAVTLDSLGGTSLVPSPNTGPALDVKGLTGGQNISITDNTSSLAVATTSALTGISSIGDNGGGLVITPSGGNSVQIDGDLDVTGTTTTIDSETLLVEDNAIYLNNGHTATSAVNGCVVVNYLPTANSGTVDGNFVAGVAGTSNPTVDVTGGTWTAGDIIQISNANLSANNGYYEVESFSTGTLTIRGVGTASLTYDVFKRDFVADATAGGTVTQINVSGICSDSSGTWETHDFGSSTASAPTGGKIIFEVNGTSPISTTTTNGVTGVSLDNSAVTPGTYGNGSNVGQFTVDSKGILTFADNVPITGVGATVGPSSGSVSYYVDSGSGNDANPGTSGSPVATLSAALDLAIDNTGEDLSIVVIGLTALAPPPEWKWQRVSMNYTSIVLTGSIQTDDVITTAASSPSLMEPTSNLLTIDGATGVMSGYSGKFFDTGVYHIPIYSSNSSTGDIKLATNQSYSISTSTDYDITSPTTNISNDLNVEMFTECSFTIKYFEINGDFTGRGDVTLGEGCVVTGETSTAHVEKAHMNNSYHTSDFHTKVTLLESYIPQGTVSQGMFVAVDASVVGCHITSGNTFALYRGTLYLEDGFHAYIRGYNSNIRLSGTNIGCEQLSLFASTLRHRFNLGLWVDGDQLILDMSHYAGSSSGSVIHYESGCTGPMLLERNSTMTLGYFENNASGQRVRIETGSKLAIEGASGNVINTSADPAFLLRNSGHMTTNQSISNSGAGDTIQVGANAADAFTPFSENDYSAGTPENCSFVFW